MARGRSRGSSRYGAGGGRKPGMRGYRKPAKSRDSHGRSRVGNPPLSSWSKRSRMP
jgi:hypothetical protein